MKPQVISAELKSYVEFRSDTDHTKRVIHDTRSAAKRRIRGLQIPNDAVGFSFFDQLEVQIRIGARVVCLATRLNESRNYLYGRVYSVARINKEFPGERLLLQQMAMNGSRRAVRSLFGRWQVLDRDDQVVSPRTRRSQ